MKIRAVALCVVLLTSAGMVHAKPFKWSSASDISTWDIHSQNNGLQNGIHASVYESLVYYNSKSFKIEPMLANAWNEVSPTQLRLTLRSGVVFHDGSPFTADDVVFSIQRAMMPTSNFTPYIQGIDKVVRVNNTTVDIITKGPNPVLLNQLTELRMMNKAWAEKNKTVAPKDIKTAEENFAHRNAAYSTPWRTRFHADGGQCSSVMPDTVPR